MAHENYMIWMSLDLDGELGDPERAELRQHLRACAACAVAWDGINRVDRMFARQPEIGPRSDFAAQVMARVETLETRRRWYPWFLAFLVVIVVAALASVTAPFVVIALGLYKPLLDLPAVASFAAYASQALTLAAALSAATMSDVGRWLTYITTDPFALGTVITALSGAAIWIGMRETMKYMREVEPNHQLA